MPTIKHRISLQDKIIGESPQYFWLYDKTEIAVWKQNDKLFISHSVCPHMGAQLQLDKEQNKLVCPWHGLSFETTDFSSDHHKYKKICSLNGEIHGDELLIFASENL